MVAIHLDDLSCDSDASIEPYSSDDEYYTRRRASGQLFAPSKYVWEDMYSDNEDVTYSEMPGMTEHARRLEQELASLKDKEEEALSACIEAKMDALEKFLVDDSRIQLQANQQQQALLESLRQQHREEYMKDCKSLQAVEETYEHEKRVEEERKRRDEEAARKQREKEQRLAEEAQKQEDLKKQERKQLEEKEKEAYKMIHISPMEALENKNSLVSMLDQYDKDLRAFCDDISMKDARRGIKKFITLSVQQISATQEQVRKKSMGLIEFLSQQQGVHKQFALVTLAAKMVSQCEAQVALIPSFAFPLGEVAASVGRAFPDFISILIGMLQKECPLCVPELFQPGPKASKNVEFYNAMKFRVKDGANAVVNIESEEEYVNRLQGYVRLYAAILQTDNSPDLANVYMGKAWSYLAWLLNEIPACRYSASALDAFLSVAGFKLYGTFRGQFEKLIKYIASYFLRDLSDTRDPDASAVSARLESYIEMRQYHKVPKGRDMPMHDASSQNRA